MSDSLPMFPLNTVLFPGVSVPLHVFEDRYRALVHHLLRVEDPTLRVFGSVGIREGYEVGEHGTQSLFRVGCRVKMTDVEANADGSFDFVAIGLDRIQLDHLDTTGAYPVGTFTQRPESPAACPPDLAEAARETYDDYCEALLAIDRLPPDATLPVDPTYLSWMLAALSPLTLPQRQSLLEAEDSAVRLHMVTDLLRSEVRTMAVIPSLPATEVARTRWSPN